MAVSDDGRRWIRKPGKKDWPVRRPHSVVAEGIAFVLSGWVEARVPAGAIERAHDCSRWLSEFIPQTVPWEQAAGAHADGLPELGRVLALDAILGNTDRHAENVLLQGPSSEGRYLAWAIDFANSAAGSADALEELGVAVPPLGVLEMTLPFELMKQRAEEAAQILAGVDGSSLRDAYVSLCRDAGGLDSAEHLATLLGRRLEVAPAIVGSYWALIEGSR